MERSWCGLLNLDKPTGRTSRDIVDIAARLLRGVKVGHAGTLDPLASGVLVVCVGKATRLIEYVQRMPKTYRTVVRLDAVSNTLDADGEVVAVDVAAVPTEAELRRVLAGQVGTILQRPPEYSALKVGGKRAYDLARSGQVVQLEARPVTIARVELVNYSWPRVELEIDCGGGTYIRSIARDVGEALGCGGVVEVLVRTRIGPFRQVDALDPADLDAGSIAGAIRPALEAVAELPRIAISADELAEIIQGRALAGAKAGGLPPGEVALVGPGGELAAIAEAVPASRRIVPRRVLATA